MTVHEKILRMYNNGLLTTEQWLQIEHILRTTKTKIFK